MSKCWFCTKYCNAFKKLNEENIYEITIHYFDLEFLALTDENPEKAICLECWTHIYDFHNFRESVIRAHSSLHENSVGIHDKEVIIKSEIKREPDVEQDCLTTSLNSESNKYSNTEIYYDIIVKEEVHFDTANEDNSEHFFLKTDEEELSLLAESNSEISSRIDNDGNLDSSFEHMKTSFSNTSSCEDNDSLIKILGERDSRDQLKRSLKRKREEELDNIISKWKPNLDCTLCNSTFTSYTLLQNHFKMNHHNEELIVQCCDIKIKKRAQLAEHVRLHIDSKAFKCIQCNKGFTRKRNLRYHVEKQHGMKNDDVNEKPTTSDIHGSRETNYESDTNDLVRFMRKPSDKQPHRKLAQLESDNLIGQWMPTLTCGICKETYTKYTLIHEHFQQSHCNQNGFVVCCERKFFRRGPFQEHVSKHINPEGFECEICGKFLNSSSNLKHHISKVHADTQEQECEISTVNIPTIDDLVEQPSKKSNKRKTIQELDAVIAEWKPNLECILCKSTCSTFTLLTQHFNKVHPGAPCYIICCELKFTGRHDIEEHIRYHKNPNAFKCDTCGRTFTSRRNLNRHLRTKHSSKIFAEN
ncbi:zinc finger Y-chromosomal protein-like [Haematobia irritans]|uniref:zinc finger Y-chromosomal protein-like n=1 Tax=Haematobia irritans TaxID=7368 RepID=UPI003F504B04